MKCVIARPDPLPATKPSPLPTAGPEPCWFRADRRKKRGMKKEFKDDVIYQEYY